MVRTAVEDGDEAVGIKPVKDGDRAVWRAAMTMGGKQIDLVVDQETGIVTWYSSDDGTFTATVEWDSPPSRDMTYCGRRAGGHGGRRRSADTDAYEESPAAAGRTAGYAPLVSDLAPDGYGLRAVATVADGTRLFAWTGHPTEAGPVSPPREPVIGQLYTRGLSWFTLEQLGPKVTRFYGPRPEGLAGLIVRREALAAADNAAVRGAQGSDGLHLVPGERAVAVRRRARRAVFVTGALTRQELIAFAEGLKPAATGE